MSRSSGVALAATTDLGKPELDGNGVHIAQHELPASIEQSGQAHELP